MPLKSGIWLDREVIDHVISVGGLYSNFQTKMTAIRTAEDILNCLHKNESDSVMAVSRIKNL